MKRKGVESEMCLTSSRWRTHRHIDLHCCHYAISAVYECHATFVVTDSQHHKFDMIEPLMR